MASMDWANHPRGSLRQAEKRSKEDTDNTCVDAMEQLEDAQEVTEGKLLADGATAAEKRPSKNGSCGAKAATRASVRQAVTEHLQAAKAQHTTVSAKAGRKGVVSRAKAVKGGVSKSAPKSRQRKATPKASVTRPQPRRPRNTSAADTPASADLNTSSESLRPAAKMDSSRESSPLSDVPDDLFLAESSPVIPGHSGSSTYLAAPQPPQKIPAQYDRIASATTAILSGSDATVGEPDLEAPGSHAEGSRSLELADDENIVVTQRRRADKKRTADVLGDAVGATESALVQLSEQPRSAPAVESLAEDEVSVAPEMQQMAPSLQVQGEEAVSPIPVRQKRRTGAPQRFGAAENAVVEPELTDLLTSDSIGDESEKDYEEPSKKRRKTSTAKAKNPSTPAKRSRASETNKPAAKRRAGRQKQPAKTGESAVIDSARTKIVTLPVRFDPSKPVPTKTTAKVTPKQPRKPASRKKLNAAVLPALPPTPDSTINEPTPPVFVVDPKKLELSQQLTSREPLGSKPRPQGAPQVWAESRQALCETLPYFKRPQGGCYQNDGHVYGFLFDSVGHCREYLDEDIIICRAGGSMEQDQSGGMVQKKDQSMGEAQVLAILNDIAHQNPHIVICGNRNRGTKCEMPHQYSVLGWYKPVAVWEERTTGKGTNVWTTIKYRLERLGQAGEPVPWHAPTGSDLASLRTTTNPVLRQRCEDCEKAFDQVYLQGWMCLNSACVAFWKIDGFSAPSGNTGLDYNPDFLLSRAPVWGDERPPAPVRPPIPDVGNIIGDNLAYINTRGICCPKCGRCNSRRLFDRWVCENSACDFELRPQHRPVMPTHLHTPWDVAPTLVRNKVESDVHLKVEHKYGYKVCTYTFDGIDGCFIHAAATKEILGAPGGPDEMMANLQSEDLGLERRVFAVTKMSGGKKPEVTQAADLPLGALPSPPQEQQNPIGADEAEELAKPKRTFDEGDLMTAFSMNCGMPYKFVASGASRSFESSPKAVNDCRFRLNWAARMLLGKSKEDLDFNEELIFTYLEGQKIEYHDDGEDGLGPEIASLSLGGRAKMYMRMKAKHFVGCSKSGILTEEKPVPGSIGGDDMYRKRLAAWQELQTLKSDPTAYNRRRRELPKELDLYEKRAKKADDLVTVTLSHGDIMVMDGYDIQRYLEHKVVPEGYLRFALTCRTVLEEHLRPEERPGYVVLPDEGRYDGTIGF